NAGKGFMPNVRWGFWGGAAALVALAAAALAAFQSPIKAWVFSQAMPSSYFSHFDAIKPALYQVAGPVYAFERGFTRSLVVRTSQGIAVIDTFSDEHAKAMTAAIAAQ